MQYLEHVVFSERTFSDTATVFFADMFRSLCNVELSPTNYLKTLYSITYVSSWARLLPWCGASWSYSVAVVVVVVAVVVAAGAEGRRGAP